MDLECTYIKFTELESKTKTKIWKVVNKTDGSVLGGVKWFGRWRGYAFYPAYPTVYEQVCLRDIARFVEDRTKEYKKGGTKNDVHEM